MRRATAITLGELAEHRRSTRLKGVGPTRRPKALRRRSASTTVLDLLTHYPRRYLDRTNAGAHRATWCRARRRWCSSRSRGSTRRRTRRPPQGAGRRPSHRRHRAPAGHVLQPAVAGAAAAAGHRGRCSSASSTRYRGQRQMTNPVVDLVGDQTGRIVPVYPQSEKARLYHVGHRRLGRRGAAPVAAAGLRRPGARRRCSTGYDLVDRDRRRSRDIHAPESMARQGRARRRLVFDELLRVQLALVLRKRALERTTRGIAHDTSTAPLRRRVPRARCRSTLTGAQQRAIAEIERRPGRPAPDAPAAAGRRRLGQDRGRRQRAARRGAGRPPGRAHGADRGAGRAARRWAPARCSTASTVPDDAARLFGERPLRVELLTNRTTRPSAGGSLAGLAAGEVDLLIGTHALIQEGVEFRSLGVVVIDEQHRFGVEQRAALRDKAGGRRGARRAGHDGHADPAHRGDDRLRRPRRVGARRAAAGPTPIDDRRGPARPTARRGSRCGSRCGPRSRPAARPTSCAR